MTRVADAVDATRGAVVAAAVEQPRDPASESPRQYLRRHLRQTAKRPSDLRWYFDQALGAFSQDAEVRLAVEELVDHLGGLLGFDVARDDPAERATWSSGHVQLLVWVLDMPMAVARLSRLAHVREAALHSPGTAADDRVSGLVVVCGPVNHRLLEDTVALRRVQDQVRLVTVDGLMALGAAVERGLPHQDARTLLQPAGALADPLVTLVARVSSRSDRAPHA